MTANRSDRGKHMITPSCTKWLENIVLTGVWVRRSDAAKPFQLLWLYLSVQITDLFLVELFHSIVAVSVGGFLFIVCTVCCCCTLFVCSLLLSGTWAIPLRCWEEIDKSGYLPEVFNWFLATLAIDGDTLVSAGVRNKWPLGTHYTSARFCHVPCLLNILFFSLVFHVLCSCFTSRSPTSLSVPVQLVPDRFSHTCV